MYYHTIARVTEELLGDWYTSWIYIRNMKSYDDIALAKVMMGIYAARNYGEFQRQRKQLIECTEGTSVRSAFVIG